MKLTDIISLAKQGYKPADIKELISMADDTTEKEEPETEPEKEEPEKEEPKTEPEKEPETEPDKSPTLDELKKEIEKLKSELKVAQQKNVRTEVDGKPQNVDDAIDDMFREYM